jgi:hypothetical protein
MAKKPTESVTVKTEDVPKTEEGDSFAEALRAAQQGADEPDDGIERPEQVRGPVLDLAAAEEIDGIILSPDGAALLGMKVGRVPHQEPRKPIEWKSFDVYANNKLLGRVKKAVDETEAIGKIVAAYRIAKPEQFMFRAVRA